MTDPKPETLTVKNNSQNPRVMRTTKGEVLLQSGKSLTAEFSAAEAQVIKADTASLRIGKDTDAPASGPDPLLANMTQQRDNAMAQLKEIADLFDSDEVDTLNVKAAVQRLIQDSKSTKVDAGLKAATDQANDLGADLEARFPELKVLAPYSAENNGIYEIPIINLKSRATISVKAGDKVSDDDLKPILDVKPKKS